MMERELKRTQRDAEVFAEKGGGIEKCSECFETALDRCHG
jgi:hypothetical protein